MLSTAGSVARTRPAEILYVEDNPADVELWRETMREHGECTVKHVADGARALEYLRLARRSHDMALPDLILLDIGLPGFDGHRVLAEIRADPMLGLIPIVVLSTSAAREEIARAYALGANAYVVKPAQLSKFRQMVRAIHDFWCASAVSVSTSGLDWPRPP